MPAGFWIETNWGESFDEVTEKEITLILQNIFKNKKSDAAFWIGDNEGLHVLEIHNDFNLYYTYGENMDKRLTAAADGIVQCSYIVNMFISENFLLFRNRFGKDCLKFLP
ncbi:hypothetical protein [Flavobacterium ginsengiterrae]|uniref:Uncharacterized protein n=1 Tax=Flavobacterium ginsengiterrae TaxID=871695 RepID=A0ABP7G8R9_9FLAO